MKEIMIDCPAKLIGINIFSGAGSVNRRIRLSGDLAKHDKKHEFESSLNEQLQVCGCDTGAKGFLVGTLLSLIVNFTSVIQLCIPTSDIIISSFIIIVLFSFMGKCYGLYQANKKLKQLIKNIIEQYRIKV